MPTPVALFTKCALIDGVLSVISAIQLRGSLRVVSVVVSNSTLSVLEAVRIGGSVSVFNVLRSHTAGAQIDDDVLVQVVAYGPTP